MEKGNLEKVILSTIAGVASGVALGFLFAPDKGKNTREKISQKGNDYLKSISKEIDELRENLNKRADMAKEDISELNKEAKSKGEEILKRAKKKASYDEWTKDELYERAKEAEINRYSTMNKDELIEALRRI
jgi:gas vesicle protein